MEQPSLNASLDGRHRNRDGEIGRKHDDTLVSTLRWIYRPSFAPDAWPHQQLSAGLANLDEPWLFKLVEDHERSYLPGTLSAAQAAASTANVRLR